MSVIILFISFDNILLKFIYTTQNKSTYITYVMQSILIAQFHFAKNCCVGSVNQIKNLDGTLSGIFNRNLHAPKAVQTREPLLNGTLWHVGFGKLFALKVIYCFLQFLL